jgi:hypothetical protein
MIIVRNSKVAKATLEAVKYISDNNIANIYKMENNANNEVVYRKLKGEFVTSIYEVTDFLEKNFSATLSGSRLSSSIINSDSDWDFFFTSEEDFNSALKYLKSIAIAEIEEFVGAYAYLGTHKLNKFVVFTEMQGLQEVQISLVDKILPKNISLGLSTLKKFFSRKLTFSSDYYIDVLDALYSNDIVDTVPPMAVKKDVTTSCGKGSYHYSEWELVFPTHKYFKEEK